MPGLLATTASAAINIMQTSPQIYSQLAENIRTFRQGLAKLEGVTIFIPSNHQSALIHVYMLSPPESIELEERLLQDVVDDALGQGVLICRAARLRGQEVFEPAPSLKIMISAAFTKKETEKMANTVRNSLTKVLGSKSSVKVRKLRRISANSSLLFKQRSDDDRSWQERMFSNTRPDSCSAYCSTPLAPGPLLKDFRLVHDLCFCYSLTIIILPICLLSSPGQPSLSAADTCCTHDDPVIHFRRSIMVFSWLALFRLLFPYISSIQL